MTNPHLELIEDMASFTHDPLKHSLYAYPWGEGALTDFSGPREWQRKIKEIIRDHLSNPLTRFTPCRIAVASGHGIGKSALIGMVNDWGLNTCDDSRIRITANTETQLQGTTWPELTKWRNLSITRDWFKGTATSFFSVQPGHEKSWRSDAVTWSERNTEAFAGLHNYGKRIIMVMDEASAIIDKVWEVAEGICTDENTEIIWLAFGNPTRNSGRFRECFGRHRNLWHTFQIDSRTVEGTNKAYLNELVETYGEDSDLVKVRVRGQFPSASSLQFIASDTVDAARLRNCEALGADPLIYGVDCARFGDDDSVLAKRCGRDAQSRPWKTWHGIDAMQLAGDIALEASKEHPDAIFVDAGNIGAAVIDRLRQLGVQNVFEVWFGGTGRDVDWMDNVRVRTKNKRAEMWCRMRSWLKSGAIPDDQLLQDDLTGVEYGYGPDQATIELEKKEHMKARGLSSPDRADALACTFAEFVPPRDVPGYLNPENYRVRDRYEELFD